MNLPIFDFAHREATSIEHRGFFDGAHNITPKKGIAEIDALFQRKAHEAEQRSATTRKPLEAKLERFAYRAPIVEETWQSVRQTIDANELMVIMPAGVMLFGVLALATDVVMLAPSLDLLDITDPDLQLVGAAGIAALGSVLLHLAWETIEGSASSKLWTTVWRILGGLASVALVLWGILRGYQVAFAAAISENPIATFISGHPVLASVFYVFITLGAPLAAAGAFTYGSRHLRDWYRHTAAKREAEKNAEEITTVKKKIEAEEDWLRHELGKIGQEREQWQHAYLRQHEHGMKNGARQTPFWLVQVKASLSAMLTLLVAWWTFALSPFSFLLPGAAYLAAFLYFRHQRIHPTPAEFFNLERVTFAESSADSEPDRLEFPSATLNRLKHIADTGKFTGKEEE